MIKYIEKEIKFEPNYDSRGYIRYTFKCPNCKKKHKLGDFDWAKEDIYEITSFMCLGCKSEFHITKCKDKIIDCEEVVGQLDDLSSLIFAPTVMLSEDHTYIRRF